MNQHDRPSPLGLSHEERMRWLEAMADQYEQLIPFLATDSSRRRYLSRASAFRGRAQRLRQQATATDQAGS